MSIFRNEVLLSDSADGVKVVTVNIDIDPEKIVGAALETGGITSSTEGLAKDTSVLGVKSAVQQLLALLTPVTYTSVSLEVPPNTTGTIPSGVVHYAVYNLGSSPTNPLDPDTFTEFTLNGVSIPPYQASVEVPNLAGNGKYGLTTYNSQSNHLLLVYTIPV